MTSRSTALSSLLSFFVLVGCDDSGGSSTKISPLNTGGTTAATAGNGGSAAGSGGSTAGSGGSTAGNGGSTAGNGGSAAGNGGSAAGKGGGGGSVDPFGGGGSEAGGSGGKGGGASACPGAPAGSPCAVFPQCGCGAGESCAVVSADGATACVDAGAGKKGAVCAGDDECSQGLSCIPGVCAPYCKTDADCGPGGFCLDASSGGKPIPGYRFCTLPCDPVTLSPCGAGATCISAATPGATTYDGGTACVGGPDKKADGEACEYDSDCTAGSWCLELETGKSTCARLCNESSGCPAMAWCQPAFEVKAGGKGAKELIGYCEPYTCEMGEGPCDAVGQLVGDGCTAAFKNQYHLVSGTVCTQGKPGCPNYKNTTLTYASDDASDLCSYCTDQVSTKGACVAQSEACSHDFDCIAVYDCYEPCSDAACYAACDAAHPTGAALSQAYQSCLCQACAEVGGLCGAGSGNAGPCKAECGG
jgi:hypothetical protein